MDDDDEIFGEVGGFICHIFWKLVVPIAAFTALALVIFQPAFLQQVNVPGITQTTNNGDSPLQLGSHMLVNTDGDVVFRDNQTSDVWSVKNTREETLFSVTNTGSVAIAGTLSGGEDGVFFVNGTENGIVLQGNDLAILAVQDGQVLTAKNTLDDSHGNAGVANNLKVGGDVAASSATIAGNASVGDTLSATKLNVGNATFGNIEATRSIKSDGTLAGPQNILDDGVGNASIANNLTVAGNAVIAGNLTAYNLNVITFTKVNVDTINVTGDAAFQSVTSRTSLTAARNTLDDGGGNAGIVGTLTAHGAAFLNGTVTTGGNAAVGGTLTAPTANLTNITSNSITASSVSVTNLTVAAISATAINTPSLTATNAGVTNNLTVGVVLSTSNSVLDDGTGAATIGGPLTVKGATLLNGTVNTVKNLLDDGLGNANIAGTLTVTNLSVVTFSKINVDIINVNGGAVFASLTSNSTLSAAQNTLDDGSGNVNIKGNIVMSAGSTSIGLMPAQAAAALGGVYMDSGYGNLHFAGGPAGTESWNVIDQNGVTQFKVYNSPLGSAPQRGVKTFMNTLDDGLGNVTVAGNTLKISGSFPVIRMQGGNGALPANSGTLSAGMKIVTYDDGTYSYGIGTASNTQWYIGTAQHQFYYMNAGVPTISLQTNAKVITTGGGTKLDDGSGSVVVAGTSISITGTNPLIRMKNTGIAPPANATTLSAGMKLLLWDDNNYDYGLGVDSSTLWYSSGAQHKFYYSAAGIRTLALTINAKAITTAGGNTLDNGSGAMTVASTLTTTGALIVNGGTQFSRTSLSGVVAYTMLTTDSFIIVNAGASGTITLPATSAAGQMVWISTATLASSMTLVCQAGQTIYYGGTQYTTSIPVVSNSVYQLMAWNQNIWHVANSAMGSSLTLSGTLTQTSITTVGSANLPYQMLNSDVWVSLSASVATVSNVTLPTAPIGGQTIVLTCSNAVLVGTKTLIGATMWYNGVSVTSIALTPMATYVIRYNSALSSWHVMGGNAFGNTLTLQGTAPVIRMTANGFAPPANSGTLSAGAKFLPYDDGAYLFGIGIDQSTQWYASTAIHKFYYYNASGNPLVSLTLNGKGITTGAGTQLDDGVGNMVINGAGTSPLVVNQAPGTGTESSILFRFGGANKAVQGFRTDKGNFWYDFGASAFVLYGSAGTKQLNTANSQLDDGTGNMVVSKNLASGNGLSIKSGYGNANLYLESVQANVNHLNNYWPVFMSAGVAGGVTYSTVTGNYTVVGDGASAASFTAIDFGLGGFDVYMYGAATGSNVQLNTAQMLKTRVFHVGSTATGGSVSSTDANGNVRNNLDDGTGKASFAGQLTLNAPLSTSSDIYFNSATRRTIAPSGNLVVGNVDIQLSSANAGTVWLNQDSKAPVKTGTNTLDDGSGNAYVAGYVAMRGGSATTPAVLHGLYGGASIIIQTAFGSPQSGRISFGDGTGWQMSISTRQASAAYAYRDLINITDGGKITTAGGNTLDDGSGNVVIAGNLNVNGVGNTVFSGFAVFNGNANFPAGKTLNFGSGLQISAGADGAISIWDLKNSVQWLYRNSANAAVAGWISTKNNLLDNGSGAMTVAGTLTLSAGTVSVPGGLTINPSGTNRLVLLVNSNNIVAAGSGNAAGVNLAENSVTYWEIMHFVGNKGTYSPTTDMLRLWYDGTGSGSKLNVFGSGKITTAFSSQLDDGAGNMVAAGTVTATTGLYTLQGTAGGGSQHYTLQTTSKNRIALGLGDVEGGTNSGSNFNIYGYNDAGTYLGLYLVILRSSGKISTVFGNVLDDASGNMVLAGTTLSITGTNPVIRMKNTGVAPPGNSGTLSAGMKLVTFDDSIYEYGIGIDTSTQWYISGIKHKFYYQNAGVSTVALQLNAKAVTTFGGAGSTLDDGSGNMVVAGTLTMNGASFSLAGLKLNTQPGSLPGHPGLLGLYYDNATLYGGFISEDFNSLILGVANSASVAYNGVAANTYSASVRVGVGGYLATTTGTYVPRSTSPIARNVLDDGSGNMVVAGNLRATGGLQTVGTLAVNPTGTTRTMLAVNSNAVPVSSQGFGATVQLLENNVYYWEFINSVGTKGTFSPANDNLNFWYDGTNPGGRLVLYGSGKITTMGNNQLDDGNGNIIAAKNLGASSAYLFAGGTPLPFATQANATLITSQYSMFRFVDPGGAVILPSTPIGGSTYSIINGDPNGNSIAVYPPLTWEFNRAAFTDPGPNNPLYVPPGSAITFVYVAGVNYYFALNAPLRYTGAKATSTLNNVLDDGVGNMNIGGGIYGSTTQNLILQGKTTTGVVQLWNNGILALNTFSGQVNTGGGNQLDDSAGNMVIKGYIQGSTTNVNFHIAPTAGTTNKVGFSNSAKNAWGIWVQDTGATPKSGTLLNVLDDGTGVSTWASNMYMATAGGYYLGTAATPKFSITYDATLGLQIKDVANGAVWLSQRTTLPGYIYTALNQLDDGLGNMNLAGGLVVGSSSVSRTFLDISNNAIAAGSPGFGAAIRFFDDNLSYWEIFNNPATAGTSSPTNDALTWWYDGTGSGSRLQLFGNGKFVTKSGNKLDDGTGAMTITNFFQVNQNVAGTGFPITAFNPGLINGNAYGIGIGYNSATMNTAQVNFGFVAAGSTSNTASLQVSGHVGVTVNGVGKVSTSNHVLDDGTTGAVALNMNTASSTIPLTIYNSGMGASSFSTMVMGKDNGAFNTAQIQFSYTASGSTSNSVSLQVSSRSGLTITGTGRLTTNGNAGNVLDDGSGSMAIGGFFSVTSFATGIAASTGGQASTALTKAINVVTNCAAGTNVALPNTPTLAGTIVYVIDQCGSGNSIGVYPRVGQTINGGTGSIAVSGATPTIARFIYLGSNAWAG